MDKISKPKFLTHEVAKSALSLVYATIKQVVRRDYQGFHIVILVPSMKDDRATNFPDWPDYALEPHVLFDEGYGRASWKYQYDKIAQCKALQLWHGRNDGGTDIKPHLLFPSDTPFFGGVKRDGIVVACSGFDPWIDRMVSGMIADACIGLAYDAWMKSSDKANGELCFLT